MQLAARCRSAGSARPCVVAHRRGGVVVRVAAAAAAAPAARAAAASAARPVPPLLQRASAAAASPSSPISPQKRPSSATKAAGAAAAAAATSSSACAFVAQAAPFALAASAGLALASAAALALFPRSWRLTQAVARARWPLVPLALAYAALLAASWEPDTLSLMMPGSLREGLSLEKGFAPQFFPTLDGVASLFARPFTAASFLVHVAVANLVAARAVFWDASARCVPAAHSILLCAVLGPVGVLAHELTKLLGIKARAAPVVAGAGGGGTITLMPYQE